MNRFRWLVAASALLGSSVAFGAAPKGAVARPAARPMPHPVSRPVMAQPRPQMPVPHAQPMSRPQQQFTQPAIRPQQFPQPAIKPSLNPVAPLPQVVNKPQALNVGPKPALNNLPSGVGKPLPGVTGPRPAVTNLPGNSIKPQLLNAGPKPGITNLPGGSTGGNVVGKPPTTLLTNPNPGVVTARPARTTGPKPAQLASTSAAHHAVVAPHTAALAAASAFNPNLTPATLALYAYSQRNASHPWWTPYGIPIGGFGYGGYGYGGFGYGGYGYGGYGYGHHGWGAFASIGWAPYGFNPFWCGGFGIGLGYHSGPWSAGIGYGWGFDYSPAIAYVPYYVEQPVIVGQPPIVVDSGSPPLIPQAAPATGPTLPPPAAAEKPAGEKPAVDGDVDYAARGQEQFLAGKYADAVKSLRHAVLDDPKNGPLLALTGEALWAAGNFNEAAGAFQQSLLASPEADWKGVANRAARLTPADSVTALGNALAKEEQPGPRFLAAYQSFGAGKYEEAIAHLDVVLKKAPEDQVAKKLREQAIKLNEGK